MSTTRITRSTRHSATAQAGFTLIVALIFLVLITLVATFSIRSVSLQTRMSAANHDRNLVYQASETGLREAEARAVSSTNANFPAAACSSGYCAEPAPSDAPRWSNASSTGWSPVTAPLSANAPDVETIVERNGDGQNFAGCGQSIPPMANCLSPRYRATSRSNEANRAAVILQSDVATQ